MECMFLGSSWMVGAGTEMSKSSQFLFFLSFLLTFCINMSVIIETGHTLVQYLHQLPCVHLFFYSNYCFLLTKALVCNLQGLEYRYQKVP